MLRVVFLPLVALLALARTALAANPVPQPAPATFPFAVWLQDPKNAPAYKTLGINLYVGLWQGPSEAQLTALEKAGMPVFCDQDPEALKPRWHNLIRGFLQNDEPDNAQSLGENKGYGPPITPDQVLARYQTFKRADPRPVMLNLGQGVAWDDYYGRGTRTHHPEDYPLYTRAGDILSFDIYPVTHDNPAVAGKLEFVAHGTQRLRQWTDPAKPVWACIECTHISNANQKPTPEQVQSEVWMALIHGARGIIYFCHQFAPRFVEAALLDDPAMCQAIKQLNQQIQDLAPALNADPPAQLATFSEKNIALLTRHYQNATYIFSVSLSPQKIEGTFTLPTTTPPTTPTAPLEVLHESRQIPPISHSFPDTFTPYQVHLYRLPDAKP